LVVSVHRNNSTKIAVFCQDEKINISPFFNKESLRFFTGFEKRGVGKRANVGKYERGNGGNQELADEAAGRLGYCFYKLFF
jgi:hypothetical protein